MKRFSYLDLVQELLPPDEFEVFQQQYTTPIQKSVKIIRKKISEKDFEKEAKTLTLYQGNFTAWGERLDDLVFVENQEKIGLWSHRLHQLGYFYVQEYAAWFPVQTMNIGENETILEMCSAPGGKTIQILDKIAPSCTLISNEVNPQRRKALLSNCERCGNEQIAITGYDGRNLWDLFFETCDQVLLDAPCSGEGMQYKSDFKIFSWNEKEVRKIANLQQELLISGLKALKVWGILTYSTCTTNPIENEMNLQKILESFPWKIELLPVEIDQKSPGIHQWRDFAFSEELVQKVARFRPHQQKTWGFFIAKLKKLAPLGEKKLPFQESSQSESLWKITKNEKISSFLKENFGISEEILRNYDLVESNLTIQVIPHHYERLLKIGIFFDQIGMPILKKLPQDKFVPLDGLAKILWTFATQNVQDLTSEEAKNRIETKTLSLDEMNQGKYLLLRWKGQGIGIYSRK